MERETKIIASQACRVMVEVTGEPPGYRPFEHNSFFFSWELELSEATSTSAVRGERESLKAKLLVDGSCFLVIILTFVIIIIILIAHR